MSNEQPVSLGNLVSNLSDKSSSLVRAEIALAKAEMAEKAKESGIGIGLLVFAAVMGTYLVGVFIIAAIYGFGNVVPMWAAALCVAAIMMIIMTVVIIIAVKNLQSAGQKAEAPASIKESVGTVKGAVNFKSRTPHEDDGESLKERAEEVLHKAEDAAKKAKDSVTHTVADVKDHFQAGKEKAEENL